MAQPKTAEVSITALKVTAEDEWMEEHILYWGSVVRNSPHYLYLCGAPGRLIDWMKSRKLATSYIAEPLIKILIDIAKNGQVEPIKIYKDMRINTGHKRAACMLFLGYEKIKAEFVEDDYKL